MRVAGAQLWAGRWAGPGVGGCALSRVSLPFSCPALALFLRLLDVPSHVTVAPCAAVINKAPGRGLRTPERAS